MTISREQFHLAFFAATLIYIGLLAPGGMAAPTLDSLTISPNPATIADVLTYSGQNSTPTVIDGGGVHTTTTVITNFGTQEWFCQSFQASETGYLDSIDIGGLAAGKIWSEFWVFDYAGSDRLGASLAYSTENLIADNLCNTTLEMTADDFNAAPPLTKDDYYFFCGQMISTPSAHLCGNVEDGNYFYRTVSDITDPAIGSALPGYSAKSLQMQVNVSSIDPVKLVVIMTGGGYAYPLAEGDYSSDTIVRAYSGVPITSGSTTIYGKFYSVGEGWSNEVATTLNISSAPAGSIAQRAGIYIVAAEALEGTVNDDSPASAFMHNYSGFGASTLGLVGSVLIDGEVQPTCNFDWNCMRELGTGSHSYRLWSTNGHREYSGSFTVDANTSIVKIYVPLTYNSFTIWEDSAKASKVTCADIFSIDSGRDVSLNKRITTNLHIGSEWYFWEDELVVPENCYTSESIPAKYPFALPGYRDGIEPLSIWYSGVNGITGAEDGELFGVHYLGDDIAGSRNRNGYTNFYQLHADGEWYENAGRYYSGSVAREEASFEDGYYSPIVSVIHPNMNTESAIYGSDINYNTGDFGLFDTVTCEAALMSYGHIVYDVNFLLVTDQNKIYAQYNFQPYTKFNSYMDADLSWDGAFNIVWHSFKAVNPGHSAKINCMVQTTNELGFKSGWAVSPTRWVYTSNYSATDGMNIFVKYEDGTLSYSGHESPASADVNYIDIYNFYYHPYYWTFNTNENPLSLFEGDGVIAQTWDRNVNKAASKSFDIGRNDDFDITLYLSDYIGGDNRKPVTLKTQMYERSAYGDIICKTDFYDKDLDWNRARFVFWTSEDGSIANPNCEKTISYAYTTNCNPANSPCYAPGATTILLNECGSDNDCYVQAAFSKRDCTSIAAGDVTGYCGIYIEDMNSNTTLAQASATITIEQYEIAAECESFALIGSAKESVIYTTEDKAFIECIIWLEQVNEITDLNFTIAFEGKALIYLRQEYDGYLGKTYYYYRAEATPEIEALARKNTVDNETWEGDGTVFVTHPLYGGKDKAVHLTVVFVGSREETSSTYTEGNFNEFYTWIESLAHGMLSNPVQTIQGRFFDILIIVVALIIFVPILLYIMYLSMKFKQGKEGG